MIPMDDRVDTRRVRYFIQVLDSGSVRGAAEVLDMDPSAVSRAIGILENDCGTRLLERHGRGVVATEAGLLLAAYARSQHEQKLQMLAELDSIQKVTRGHVDIVAGEGFIESLMRRSLSSFMQANPGITVNLDVGSTDEIVRRVIDGSAHIGIVFEPPKDARLHTHYTHPQPIQAQVLESHPLAKFTGPLDLQDLLPYPGATLHRTFGVRQHIEAAEVSEGVRLRSILTTSSFTALGYFVAAGLGYALFTRMTNWPQLAHARLVAVPMKNPLLSHGKAHIVSRQGRVLSPAAARLMRQIMADVPTLVSGNT
jgi:Transcriptional regulator